MTGEQVRFVACGLLLYCSPFQPQPSIFSTFAHFVLLRVRSGMPHWLPPGRTPLGGHPWKSRPFGAAGISATGRLRRSYFRLYFHDTT